MAPEEHLTAEQLVRVATGALAADERQAALAHLEVCEPCGDRLAAVLLLREARRRPPRLAWAATAAAAALVMVGGLSALGLLSRAEPAPEPLSPERQALVERWAGYASRENIEPMYYDFILRIVYPDVVTVSPDRRHEETRAAVIDLRDGRYDAAIEKLVALQVAYPDFDTIAGWLGVALHLSGQTDPLVETLLERGTHSGIELLRELGFWYGAQQLMLSGRPEEAFAKLTRLAEHNTTVGRLGRGQLTELPWDELDLPPDARAPQSEQTSWKKRTCRHHRAAAARDPARAA